MRRISLVLLAMLSFCLFTQCSDAISEVQEKGEPVSGKGEITHGICRQNLQWVKDYAEVEQIADNMVKSKIPLVRISGVKGGGTITQVIDNINTFNAKGIQVLIVIPFCDEMFPVGYQKVPGPSFDVYKMSDIDTVRFKDFINSFVSEIASKTAEDALIGLELFNEVNWGGFNGDLQTLESGKGEVFTTETSLTTPSFADIYKGINAYGKCLKILRKATDLYLPERDLKLITAGLVASGAWNDFQWAKDHGFTVVRPDMFFTLLQGIHLDQADQTNYLNFADAIGIHCYPPHDDNMENMLRTYHFNPINAVLSSDKSYWITEWGFSRDKFKNNGGEAERLNSIHQFIDAAEKIGNIEVATFYEFDASTNHNIWENGKLLESGGFFKEVNQ